MKYKKNVLATIGVFALLGALICLLANITIYGNPLRSEVVLKFTVIDKISGKKLANTKVELVNANDRYAELAPNLGMTDNTGKVNLRANVKLFTKVTLLKTNIYRHTFDPWLVRVTALGYKPYTARLGPDSDSAYPQETAPCLNVVYPVTEPVKLLITPANAVAH